MFCCLASNADHTTNRWIAFTFIEREINDGPFQNYRWVFPLGILYLSLIFQHLSLFVYRHLFRASSFVGPLFMYTPNHLLLHIHLAGVYWIIILLFNRKKCVIFDSFVSFAILCCLVMLMLQMLQLLLVLLFPEEFTTWDHWWTHFQIENIHSAIWKC